MFCRKKIISGRVVDKTAGKANSYFNAPGFQGAGYYLDVQLGTKYLM